MTEIINLNPKKLSAKAAIKLINSCVKKRSKETGEVFTKKDFLDLSGLTRTHLHRFRHGKKPSVKSAYAIAVGLKKLGYEVNIVVD